MPPELAEVQRWLRKAQNDRRAAEGALAQVPPITDIAAFHCQQAVEKLLKAYLVWRGHEFEKIHDLRVLTNQCGTFDPAFGSIRATVAPLTAYAVNFRYPGPADPTVEQTREALAVVRDVWDFVVQRLPRETWPPPSGGGVGEAGPGSRA